jgi:hypothetical protein
MEATIKTWIQPLPDTYNNKTIRGITSTRLGKLMLYSSTIPKYDNVLVV